MAERRHATLSKIITSDFSSYIPQVTCGANYEPPRHSSCRVCHLWSHVWRSMKVQHQSPRIITLRFHGHFSAACHRSCICRVKILELATCIILWRSPLLPAAYRCRWRKGWTDELLMLRIGSPASHAERHAAANNAKLGDSLPEPNPNLISIFDAAHFLV